VLVTDLDNTLYDWVEVWHRSFSAMLDVLLHHTGTERDLLLDEIREVHRAHGTSEYAFVAEELPSVQLLGEGALRVIASANEARRRARNDSLRLYPGVSDTLRALKAQGVLVIGYTESMAFYSASRVRKLGLDGLLDVLYSPRDHELPRGVSREQLRRHPEEHYAFEHTIHRHTPPGELKPNPAVLLDILADSSATPDSAVYVGDSPMKDVAMARDAGVADVLALYGKAQDREAYQLLRRVTHWSENDVARERRIVERGEVAASHVLKSSFGELRHLFHFVPYAARRSLKAASA
jgi:phosphoglycolate phosphatase